ncbi:TRAP transporter substrate-binding protein [Paracoccus aminophilus]|uniref:TRAP dicarboxylate transporter, DctP subunit n=1 Tax=Paracoccus aminophilus JCM 7686 TaxID=1367847 RepID=S5YAQ7_PARAH|nr:TRAP transporter substrate-binding protein [Paracoccus aminophilus]AGT08508.1 TRAP dicarboxylate transporter, DctP subunit [Paracoccus aminophilus JCM 7686]
MKYSFALAAVLSLAALGAEAAPVTLRLGHAVFEAHPNHDTAVRFKEAVERISNGDVKIEIFPARQLGDVKELMEGVEMGTIDMTVNSSSALATMIPAVDAFQLPGIIPDYAAFAKLAKSPSARAIMDRLEDHDMIALGLYDGGQRHFLTVKAPVEKIADFKGLKTRVAPVPLFIDIWKELGTNPTPMAYGEVYSALETGALDAVEINLSSIASEKFYEVAKGVTLTGHYFWPSFLLVNKDVFNGLDEEQQQAMRQAAAETIEPQVMAVAELDDKIKANLAEHHIPVITPTPEFNAEMKAVFAPLVDRYKAKDPLIAAFADEATELSAQQ